MSSIKSTIAERARQYIRDRAWILDTETTAAPWINPNAEVCEIAIVNASGTVEFSSLIKTVYPIDPETSKIHGITNEMCEKAPTWGDIHLIVAGFLADNPVLAYNATFDSGVLAMTAAIAGSDASMIKAAQWGCLMKAYQDFGGYTKWQKLATACNDIGYQFEGNAHRAMADAKAARAVLLYLAGYTEPQQAALLEVPAGAADEYLKGEV